MDFFTVEGSLDEELVLDPEEDMPPNNYAMTMMKSPPKNHEVLNEEEHEMVSDQKVSKNLETDYESSVNYRYPMSPLPKGPPVYLTSKIGHVLWRDEWKITEKGEFINIDE